MNSILEELYNGRINPIDEIMPTLEEYRATFCAKERVFVEKLDEPLRTEFESLLDDYFTCFPVEMAEEFSRGFKMAVRLVCEIFYGENFKIGTESEKQNGEK